MNSTYRYFPPFMDFYAHMTCVNLLWLTTYVSPWFIVLGTNLCWPQIYFAIPNPSIVPLATGPGVLLIYEVSNTYPWERSRKLFILADQSKEHLSSIEIIASSKRNVFIWEEIYRGSSVCIGSAVSRDMAQSSRAPEQRGQRIYRAARYGEDRAKGGTIPCIPYFDIPNHIIPDIGRTEGG